MTPQDSDRCRTLLTQISRWLDGDLAGSDRRALVTHLKQCPCCESVADSLRRTMDACHKAGSKRLPPALRERARRRVAVLLVKSRKAR